MHKTVYSIRGIGGGLTFSGDLPLTLDKPILWPSFKCANPSQTNKQTKTLV